MVREFSEEKKEEIFRILDEIDMKEWKPFMEWCGSSVEEFGDWPEKLNVSAYTRYVDEYHKKVLELNEMTRQQVNTVFENVAEIDARYAERMRECQEKIKEQIAAVRTMTEFMQSMTDGNPNMALLCGGNVSKAVDRTESPQNGKEEQQPKVIVLDSGGREDQATNIINEAEAQGIIGKPEIAFMNQLKYYISYPEVISFGCIDGLEALHDKGLISEENYKCLSDIKEQVDGPGDYNIFDLKEQARNVYTEILKVIAERTTIEKYIDEEVLRDVLNYNIDKLDENFVEQLRTLMLEGGIVTDTSILFFLATIGVETGEEVMLLEDRDRDDFDGLSYTWNTRGAGVIQVTGGTQKEFIEYLIAHTDDKEERHRLLKYSKGFEARKETIKVNGEDKEIVVWDNKYTYNGMTVAEYIAEYYPYESAVWFWSYNRASFEIDGQDLSINECIEQYHGVVDDDTMFLAVTCAVNGSEFKARGRGRFLYSYNDVTIVGNKIELTFVDTEGDMVGTSAYNNNFLYTNGDGYRVYKQTSYIPNGWNERLDLYNNLIDHYEEN